jgi:hypothetical protein
MNKDFTNVRIIVANIGGTDAILKAISENIIWERKKNVRLFFEADSKTSVMDGPVIQPGMQAVINIASELEITTLKYAPGGEVSAKSEVLAIGVIEYEDQRGGRYAVGFSRVYDADRNRFRVLDPSDPEADREYED